MELLSEISPGEYGGGPYDPPLDSTANFKVRSDRNALRIEARSNASANRRALIICVSIVSIAAIAIAIMFALFGAWLILPFAGLEIALLAIGTFIVCSHTDDADSLVITRNYVHLAQRRRSQQSVSSFIRQSTRIVLSPGETGHEPVRLLVVCRAEKLEIGEFLIESSKKRLHRQLTEWVSNHV